MDEEARGQRTAEDMISDQRVPRAGDRYSPAEVVVCGISDQAVFVTAHEEAILVILGRDLNDLMLSRPFDGHAGFAPGDRPVGHFGLRADDGDAISIAPVCAGNRVPIQIDRDWPDDGEPGRRITTYQVVGEQVAAARAEGIATENSLGGAVAEGESSSAEQCGESGCEKLFRVHARCSFAIAVRGEYLGMPSVHKA